MNRQPKITNYVSPMDQFLNEFDKNHPQPSKSQLKEQDKYRRVYFLRDNPERPEETAIIWEGF